LDILTNWLEVLMKAVAFLRVYNFDTSPYFGISKLN